MDLKEQFCSYEIALALKELGFDEKCLGYFNNKELNYGFSGKLGYSYKVFTWKAKKEVILAPLWQQAIDWLWKEHKILVFHYWIPDKTQTIMWVTQFIQADCWSTKEQAILKCIELCQKMN